MEKLNQKKNPYIGSSFESLFDELGEREEFERFVQKKMIDFELSTKLEWLGLLNRIIQAS